MAKSKDAQKNVKKEPLKTPKEKKKRRGKRKLKSTDLFSNFSFGSEVIPYLCSINSFLRYVLEALRIHRTQFYGFLMLFL